jgi:hypothetical protein
MFEKTKPDFSLGHQQHWPELDLAWVAILASLLISQLVT